jgi:CrcB protein
VTAGTWLAVAAIGGAGAIARFVLDGGVAARTGARLPLGTLAVNLLGAFVLGVLTGAGVTGNTFLLGGTALIGSFTTFSTWMYESQRLVEDGDVATAWLNVALSLALGLGAAAVGRALGGV